MSNLLSIAEFIALRNISKKVDNDKLQESIDLAEGSDLNDILGDFFFDLLENYAASEYTDLMNGVSFEYCGEKFTHKGIKALLADYTYSRFIYMINVNLTPFGAQTKFTQDSEGISRNAIKDISKQAQIDAGIKFRTIKKYLLSKPETFTRYCETQSTDTGFNSQKIYKL